MAEHSNEYLKAPEEHIKTWNFVHHLMLYSGAGVLILLLFLGLIVLR
jgi:hypothetical protein